LLRYTGPAVGFGHLAPAVRKVPTKPRVAFNCVQSAGERIWIVRPNEERRFAIDDHLGNPADSGCDHREASGQPFEDDQRVVLSSGGDDESTCPAHPCSDAGGGVGSLEGHAIREAQPFDLPLQFISLPALADDRERPAAAGASERFQQYVHTLLGVETAHKEEAVLTGVGFVQPRVSHTVVENWDLDVAPEITAFSEGLGAKPRCRQHEICPPQQTSFQVEALERTEPPEHVKGSPGSQPFREIRWIVVMTRSDAEDAGRQAAKSLGGLGGRPIEDIGPPLTNDLGGESTQAEDVSEESGAFRDGPCRVRDICRSTTRGEEGATGIVSHVPEGQDQRVMYPLPPSGAGVVRREVLDEKEAHGPTR